MKYEPKRVDKNQGIIVQTLRRFGISVSSCHVVGYGFPDLAVGVRGLTLVGDFNIKDVIKQLEGIEGLTIHPGANLLLEVKNPDTKQPWRMTACEQKWHRFWRGQKAVVETPADALKVCGKKVLG